MEQEHESKTYQKSNFLQKRSIRPISMGKSQSKAVIYINCGMHAREWISISSCLWMINEVSLVDLWYILLATAILSVNI